MGETDTLSNKCIAHLSVSKDWPMENFSDISSEEEESTDDYKDSGRIQWERVPATSWVSPHALKTDEGTCGIRDKKEMCGSLICSFAIRMMSQKKELCPWALSVLRLTSTFCALLFKNYLSHRTSQISEHVCFVFFFFMFHLQLTFSIILYQFQVNYVV